MIRKMGPSLHRPQEFFLSVNHRSDKEPPSVNPPNPDTSDFSQLFLSRNSRYFSFFFYFISILRPRGAELSFDLSPVGKRLGGSFLDIGSGAPRSRPLWLVAVDDKVQSVKLYSSRLRKISYLDFLMEAFFYPGVTLPPPRWQPPVVSANR